MNTPWSMQTRYIVGVGLALFVVFLIYISRSVIPLLAVAGLIAFAVRPVIGLLQRGLRLPRGVAVATTYLAVMLLLPLAALVILAALAEAVNFVLGIDYGAVVDRLSGSTRGWLSDLRSWVLPFGPLDAYVDGLVDSILATLDGAGAITEPQYPGFGDFASQIGAAVTMTFGAVGRLVGNIFSSLILFIFVFLSAIYFTTSAASYRDAMVRALPERYQPEVVELLRRVGLVWTAFFRGQISLMLIIGAVVWVGLAILGVPGALSLAIIAGLLEVVPNLGPIVATIPAVVVALLQGSTYLPVNNFVLALLVIGFYVLVQQLENSLIVPRVLGDAVDLPALVVMSGVFVGGSVAGILGALLATPLIATGREVLSYLYRKLLGEPPFPPRPAPVVAPPKQRQARKEARPQKAAPAPRARVAPPSPRKQE